ncbi:MAG TPA: 1-acyl-sn-glycerol-3-phosphate acyltransferase [Gammaproteobacteria bacterium]|nr:1-acyl-sn-glycerol-3-phosphate acyltransferase [Gammaproteobacteria bacterium]
MMLALTTIFLLALLLVICLRASEADWGRGWRNALDGLVRLFCRYFHRFEYQPVPLPEQGPALVVSNHLSGLDPLLLITASRRPLRFLIAEEEYYRFGFTWLFRAAGCIPVDRSRRPDIALLQARRALEQGEVIALFPHGRIHLDSDPPRKLKGGVVKLAQWHNCLIYPVRLDGIRGQGRTVSAVMMRSRARLRSYPPLDCAGQSPEWCLERVREYIEGEK